MKQLQQLIESAFEQRSTLSASTVSKEILAGVNQVLELLDRGKIRVAEPLSENSVGQWRVNQWIKKAVLLSFCIKQNRPLISGDMAFFDKVELKFTPNKMNQIETSGVRIVPPAVARSGCYLAPNVVMMPSYVNIGAYVGTGTMIDTWATVGSCAQIGCHVHLSGGVGIGGVLEPLQANPTIIEDNCFIGARSEIVEGVIVERDSVISMGVYISQSTKIYNRETGEIHYGRVPAGSVVVSGSLPAKDNSHSLYCAVIVKTVDAKTRAKVAVNELLRMAQDQGFTPIEEQS